MNKIVSKWVFLWRIALYPIESLRQFRNWQLIEDKIAFWKANEEKIAFWKANEEKIAFWKANEEKIAFWLELSSKSDYVDPIRNPTASEFEVDLWMLSRFVVERLLPVLGTHPYPLNELMLASSAACRLKPSVVFDWGTHIGASARLFYEVAQAFGLDYEIHSIDLPPDASHVEHPGQEHGRLVRGLPRVHLHHGDGLKASIEQWNRLGQPKQPLFFIDGDHEYESAQRDLFGIIEAIPDASVLIHDTFFQSAESNYNVGPARAVAECVSRWSTRFIVLHSNLGLPGMTLLANATAIRSIGRPASP